MVRICCCFMWPLGRGEGLVMASAAISGAAAPPAPRRERRREAVYVAAVPLRAARGPGQAVMTAAYAIGVWDLQHFMVVIKPDPVKPQALAFDFQPKNPENVLVAVAALSQREVPGVVLKRNITRLPRSRCWFVGLSNADAIGVANKFSEDWSTDLIIGKHDCRHYTCGLVEKLTGEPFMLENLRTSSGS